jgi:SOS response regulatory protein OraA/RecX
MERAAHLAARGAGDLLIDDDLVRHGVPAEAVRAAIEALEPESTRVDAIVETRGSSPRTARYLAARGFSEASLEPMIANLASDALG